MQKTFQTLEGKIVHINIENSYSEEKFPFPRWQIIYSLEQEIANIYDIDIDENGLIQLHYRDNEKNRYAYVTINGVQFLKLMNPGSIIKDKPKSESWGKNLAEVLVELWNTRKKIRELQDREE